MTPDIETFRIDVPDSVGAFGVLNRRVEVPTGCALFPKERLVPPRVWAERAFRVARWTEMPRGGHFAALEEPELLVDDTRAFVATLRRR